MKLPPAPVEQRDDLVRVDRAAARDRRTFWAYSSSGRERLGRRVAPTVTPTPAPGR